MKLFRHRRVWIGCGAVALLLAGIVYLLPYLVEPRYQGKRLSYWLREYVRGNARAQAQAKEAVLAIGPDGVPTLVRLRIPPRESSLKKILERKLSIELIQDQTAESEQRHMGEVGFRLLGERAAPAIPLLVPMLEDSDRARPAWDALVSIGPPALPIVQQYLTSTNSEARQRAVWAMVSLAKTNQSTWQMLVTNNDPVIRAEAYSVLSGRAGREPKVYDWIVAGLNDPNELAASRAALAFRNMGDMGTNALPRLHELQKTTNALLATEIAWTIKSLNRRMRLQQSHQEKKPRPE